MEPSLEQKISLLRQWLGTGSINIFGYPMSGKDTVGVRLAEVLGGKFLSSGLIIRAMEKATSQHLSDKGELINTDVFFDWVLPYFDKPELDGYPLILSSIGRWSGEEDVVMERAASSGHEIKAAVILNVSEADVESRWETAHALKDRGDRKDDSSPEVFKKRLEEFREKTAPVLLHYKNLGLLVEVRADASRDDVFKNAINSLFAFSQK